MSRSYKKTPVCTDKVGKHDKRIANHSTRQFLKRNLNVILTRNEFKKIYCTYNIHDYKFFATWKEYWNCCKDWNIRDNSRGYGDYKKLDEEKEFRYWYKWYKGK